MTENVRENSTAGKTPGGKKPFNREKISRSVFIVVMMAIPVIHFLVFTIYLNLNTVIMSFQTKTLDGQYVFLSNPFANYIYFFENVTKPYSAFPTMVLNSLVFFLLNDVVIVPGSVVLTYFLYKKVFLHRVFRIVFYLPCIVSMVVMVMTFRFMFDSSFGVVNKVLEALGLGDLIPEHGWLGTRNTSMGLLVFYCIWGGLGGNFILLASAMQRVPDEVVEAAKLDGCGFMREMWSITIPLIGSTLATLYMMGTTVIFTFYLQVKLLTNGNPDGRTGTIMFYIVETVKGDTNDLTGAATVGMIVAVIGTPIVLLTRKIVDRVFPSYEY